MARADLSLYIARAGHVVIPALTCPPEGCRPDPYIATFVRLWPGVSDPTWTDAYGVTRHAREMLTEHLWNVMGFIRHKRPFGYRDQHFYWAAQAELRRRGVL